MKKMLLLLAFGLSLHAFSQQKFTVYFDFDIDESNRASTQTLSQWIEAHRDAEIVKIYGYADSTGDSLYNIDLSERRASYVYEQLKTAGLKMDNVEEKGFGESQSTGSRNPKDRKVVFYWEQQPVVLEKSIIEPKPSELTKMVKEARKGDKIKVPELHFYNNSDMVLPTSRPILGELLKIMQDNPLLKIDIQGHICCQKVEQNQISLKRAMAVYNFLIRNGVNKSRLSYQSFGSSRPVHPLPEKSEAEKAANRRVEIEIIEN